MDIWGKSERELYVSCSMSVAIEKQIHRCASIAAIEVEEGVTLKMGARSYRTL